MNLTSHQDAKLHADKITRQCVHCGFCLATCPSYQVLGEEMNSPRGRIYLLQDIFNDGNNKISQSVISALDKCLLCRSCETTCPSGVKYHQLLEIGRLEIDRNHRQISDKTIRFLLRKFLTSRNLFKLVIASARLIKPILSSSIKRQIPTKAIKANLTKSKKITDTKVLLLANCVQPVLAPNINQTTIAVLNKLNVEVELINNCCGAIDQHLGGQNLALTKIKTNIDNWQPKIISGNYQHIISNVSGCGLMINDYAELLQNDPEYYEKAQFISEQHLDISEYLAKFDLSQFKPATTHKISIHSPCTLQYGQQNSNTVSIILQNLGFEFTDIVDNHLCCGSAGTYSILQPKIANQLAHKKLKHLTANNPQTIVSSNIGCINHLQSKTTLPVKHWIELLDYAIV